MSQLNKIKQKLQTGASLTAIDAFEEFGCFRMAARIADLRNQGMNIKTTIIEKNKKRFASYQLIQ